MLGPREFSEAAKQREHASEPVGGQSGSSSPAELWFGLPSVFYMD